MNISDKALLVKMSISQWYNQTSDKKLAAELALQHNAKGREQDKYIKRLIPNGALDAVRAVISQLREYHNNKTLPWKENGVRILPSASFMEYQKQVAALRGKLELEVKLFAAKYPDWVARARASMGSMFQEDDYPSAEGVKDKFTLEVSCMPFPNEADFRIGIDLDAMDELRATTAQQIRTALEDATNNVRLRVLDRIKLLYNALKDPDKVFRDETFYAVSSGVEDARQLNLTNDMDLAVLLDRTEFLKKFTPKMLRSQPLQRTNTAGLLHEILLSYPQ
jgi:hypothetical protein